MPGTVSHISSRTVQVIIGVDTHKDQHVAVAIDGRGVRLDEKHVPVAICGYEELERWSRSLGQIHAFGIEGTGSYGAGLARFLTDRSHAVVEVNHKDLTGREARARRHLSAIEKGRVTPLTPRWQRAQCLQGLPMPFPSLARAKSK